MRSVTDEVVIKYIEQQGHEPHTAHHRTSDYNGGVPEDAFFVAHTYAMTCSRFLYQFLS
jgi:hypothetical protein